MNKWLFSFILITIVTIAFCFRFSNLDQPSKYLFDEDLYVYTSKLLLQGDKKAFEWWHPPDTTIDSPYQYRPPAVEWLHPPLSKYAIAKSIFIFGNQPWAWRLPSAVAGVGLVLAIGWLAHTLFDKKLITLLAMSIASIESFLIVQSRLASADIFVALFTTAALASFAQWQMKNWRWGLPLAGVLSGLAMASKWSGGLIILAIFFLLVIEFFQKQKRKTNSLKAFLVSIITIIIIPLTIYFITYLPALALGHTPAHIIELHRQAWQYHTTNRAVHPNSSPAYMWLLNQKPVWYYFNEELGKSIKAQASPIIFWGSLTSIALSILAIIYSSRSSIKQSNQQSIVSTILRISTKEKRALLTLIIAFLAFWLPWLFVQRPTFFYHFLPCVPVLIVIFSRWVVKLYYTCCNVFQNT